MNLIKIFLSTTLLIMAFSLSGCQGNNSDSPTEVVDPGSPDNNDSNVTLPDLPPSDGNITSNINSLALSIGPNQDVILDMINNTQTVIVTDTTPVSIKINAFDINRNSASEGTINVAFPSSDIDNNPITYLGTISPASISISNGGEASFIYTPPNNIEYLKSLGNIGTTAFTFYDVSDTSKTAQFFFRFTDPKYTNAILKLYPEDNITVVAPLENKVIELYLEDNNTHEPIADEKITLSSFDTVKYGNMSSFSGTTDENGRVVFNYTAPEDISDLSTLSLTFTLENEKLITVTKDINFNALIVDPKYKDYELSIFPQNSVTLTEASQSTVIEVYLENRVTSLPVSGEGVTIDFFENAKGTMNAYIGTTDESGRVLFNYTAPESITGLADLNITAKLVGDVNNLTYTTIKYDNNGVPKDYNGYTLYVVPANADVTLPNQEKIIDVYLKDPNSRPAIGETVYIDFFSGEDGTMDQYQTDTDENGRASFVYTSPSVLKADGQNYLVTVGLNGTNTSDQNVTLNVKRDTDGILTQLLLLPSEINILKSEEKKTLRILTLDANNVGVSSNVVIEQPNTDTNGTDYGSFDSLKITTDINGIADVNFTAPTNIDVLADTNKTIIVRDLATLKEANLTIFYEKNLNLNRDIYEIGLTQNSDIAVDSSGELYVSIFKSNLPDTLIASEDVLEVNVTSVNFNSMVYFDENDLTSIGLVYSGKAEQAFSLFAKQTSGVVVVDVSARINDGISEKVISGSFPVVINSGEMSSISMFLAKSVLDPDLNIYNDYYTVNAVDKYGNPVSAGTVIQPKLINGVKVDSLELNGTGELKAGANAIFKDMTADFSTITTDDRLIVLPSQNVTDKSFFGNWDINDVNTTQKELTLFDKLDKNSTAKLRYVIGDETRVVTANGSSSIALANIQAIDGKYETNSKG
ncbi:MAG: hypothetical protein U9N39_03165, partial [Campylobacterota bacterium]|nr:hypothetical protein [Campylobacterota bacterium]